MIMGVVVMLSGALAQTAEPASAPAAIHPVITEVLFAVPTDDGTGRGDANSDGTREVAGDEFVEIANTTDEPIQLRGYVLRDSAPQGPSRFEFEFPELTLEPGGCAVVFNGCNARWDGPVGDTNRAPESPNPLYHDAHIFTARCSGRVTFANAGDWILLLSPEGEKVQCVSWGLPRVRVPTGVSNSQNIRRASGMSIQRDADSEQFSKHAELDDRLYSPGEAFVTKPEPDPEPDPKADPPKEPSNPDKATRPQGQ